MSPPLVAGVLHVVTSAQCPLSCVQNDESWWCRCRRYPFPPIRTTPPYESCPLPSAPSSPAVFQLHQRPPKFLFLPQFSSIFSHIICAHVRPFFLSHSLHKQRRSRRRERSHENSTPALKNQPENNKAGAFFSCGGWITISSSGSNFGHFCLPKFLRNIIFNSVLFTLYWSYCTLGNHQPFIDGCFSEESKHLLSFLLDLNDFLSWLLLYHN